jgi:hypothetical protein
MGIINSTSFTSVSLESVNKAVILMVSTQPSMTEQNDPPVAPGQLIGYYNEGINKVELFVSSAGGTFWRRVG